MPNSKKYAVSLDMGGTNLKGAIISRDGQILKKVSVPTEADSSRDKVIGNIIHTINELVEDWDETDGIVGIGVGCPGSIDTRTGTIVGGAENIPYLNGVCLSEEINSKFPYPVYVDNDATNAVKGEFLFGAGQSFDNIVCITLGTGIGAGIILNGDIYHGTSDYAGELGHMIVVPEGRPCTCGNMGCVEAYSSATAMVQAAKYKKKKRLASMLLEIEEDEITTELIVDLAQKGDKHCSEIIHEAAKYIGITLASVTNLLNLQLCIIGGGVSAAGSVLFDVIESYFYTYAMPEAARHCRVLPASLGNDAGTIGAAAMVFMIDEKISND